MQSQTCSILCCCSNRNGDNIAGPLISFMWEEKEAGCIYRTGISLTLLLFSGKKKKRETMTSQTLLLRQHRFTHTHWGYKHPEHMVPSAKYSMDYKVDRSGGVLVAVTHSSSSAHPLVMCAISPCLLTLPWYVPDRCQRHSNEEDQLQRQLVQRQLAWTRRQTEQRVGGHILGCEGEFMDLLDQLFVCMTGTD